MPSLRVAVLGGTGFIGHDLCRRLVDSGHRVLVLSRRREQHRDLLVLPTLQIAETDVHNPAQLKRDLQGMDAVVNLVGILNETRRQSFEAVHAELPAKVVQACRQAGVRRLLHMSALHAAVDAPSRYLQSKARGEGAVREAGGGDLSVTIFRPSVVFGPHDSFTNRFAELLRRIPGVFPLACAGAKMQPVYVEDVTRAFAAALSRTETFGRSYELCGPEVFTLEEIVRRIAAAIGRRRLILPLGERLSRLQAAVLQFAPGKPFTPDNYQSLTIDSTCDRPFPAFAGVQPARFDDKLTGYQSRET